MLENLKPAAQRGYCRVIAVRQLLELKDQHIFDQMLIDPKWSAHDMARQLRTVGITLAKDTIRFHRDGSCRCSKN